MAINDDLAIIETENALNNNIDKNKSIKTKKKFVCKIYKVFNDNDYVFIFSQQDKIIKYLSKIKSRGTHKNKKIIDILNGYYNFEFIETFGYDNKEEINNKIIRIDKQYQNECNKKLDLKFGLSNEDNVLYIISKYFKNDDIIKASYKYSIFDYMGLKSKYLYELKTNRDKYFDYPNAIIGVNKVIKNMKQIFLFQFTTDTIEYDLYYFIKPNDFETKYTKRQIYLQVRNIYNWIYDIPRVELIKINPNDTINLDLDLPYHKLFSHYYNLDKVRADTE